MNSLVENLRRVAGAVSKAADWIATQDRITRSSDNYIFEFLCYCMILKAAKKKKIRLRLVRRNGKPVFPKAPAKKENYSYFILQKPQSPQNCVGHLCAGTQIFDINSKARAPDISLQDGDARDAPCYHHIKAIWDAKYYLDFGKRITGSDFAKFAHMIIQLKVKRPGKEDGLIDIVGKFFSVSSLITNGGYSTEPKNTLIGYGFSEVRKILSNNPEQRPTREEQIDSQ